MPWITESGDVDAIHDNVAAEISAITSKVTPVSGDFLLIEDSAAANAKKKITIGDLPGAATALNGLSDVTVSSPVDNEVLTYDSGAGVWVNQGGAGDPYIIEPGFKPPASPDADDDEFNSDSSADYTAVTPTGTPSWTLGSPFARLTLSGAADQDLVALVKPVTFTVGDHWTTHVRRVSPSLINSIGVVFSDGTTASSNILWGNILSDERLGLETGTFTFCTTSYPRISTYRSNGGGIYIRLTYVSSNTFRVEYSINGYDWDAFAFADLSYTLTPTHVGIGAGFAVGTGTRHYEWRFLRKNWTPDWSH